MSGELTHDYKTLFPGQDFDAFLPGINFNGEDWDDVNGDGIYTEDEAFTDSNGNGLWDSGDSIRF